MNQLRKKHAEGGLEGRWYGVDCMNCNVTDTFKDYIWEPVIVKESALSAATEAACLILSIDETVKNPQSEKPQGGMGGKGKGKGMGGMGKGRGRGRGPRVLKR